MAGVSAVCSPDDSQIAGALGFYIRFVLVLERVIPES